MDDRLDVGAVTVDGGYFLSRPGSRAVPFLEHDPDATFSHVITYRDSPQTIRSALLELIATARRKVFVASFFLGDKELTNALREAAARLRGGVYVISAIDDRSLKRGLKELEDEPGKDATERKRFDELCRAGIYVRGHENCHAKFAVADDRVALVSSANFTCRALSVTGESGVLIRDPAEAERLARLFARLWHTGCTWEIPPVPPGGAYTAGPRAAESWMAGVPQPEEGPNARVIWTDDREQHVWRHLLAIVADAREELLLATWSLNKMTSHPQLLFEAVCAAVKRGVRTRMLVRTFNHRPGHRAECLAFAEAGAEICADTETHAKGAFADADSGVLFSANFDADHGLTSGVEIGCRLDGTSALATARHFVQHMMEHGDAVFVRNPTQRDLHDRLLPGWQGAWPLPERVDIIAPISDWQSLAKNSGSGPVLFTSADNGVELISGMQRWLLSFDGDMQAYRLMLSSTGDERSAKAYLEDWLQRKGSGTRGFCPAVLTRTAR
ncbi:phospholipase D-like domain-containing protein [Nonomuraea jabiensis]|uniref:phospholipase D-like domain-containing protein n=1 Tax=Nonomuraea jabiensis TaxID=882448 RepID=UPI00369338B7